MGKKLFIGNLPFAITDEHLRVKFSLIGVVESAHVMTDRESGRSQGFGFVEMRSDAEARAAIDKLNGSDMGGRAMIVSEARPQAPRNDGKDGGGRGGAGDRRGGDGTDRGDSGGDRR